MTGEAETRTRLNSRTRIAVQAWASIIEEYIVLGLVKAAMSVVVTAVFVGKGKEADTLDGESSEARKLGKHHAVMWVYCQEARSLCGCAKSG